MFCVPDIGEKEEAWEGHTLGEEIVLEMKAQVD